MAWKTPRERAADYALVFGTPAGQRVLRDLKSMSFVGMTTLDPNPAIMGHREGRRSLVLAIVQAIAAASAKPDTAPVESELDV